MKFSAVALILSVVLGGPALAAPGDPRLIQGTLEWPAALSGGESFIVLRGDDGRVYYADVVAAQRRVQGAVSGGSRMAILGLEGTRPYEILAVALASGDAAALSLALAQPTPTAPPTLAAAASTPTLSPQPSTPAAPVVLPAPPAAPAPVPSARPEEERPARGSEGRSVVLRGSFYGVAGQNLFIRQDDGTLAVVDISKLVPSIAQQLRPGSPIGIVAIPVGNKYLATGFPGETISTLPPPQPPGTVSIPDMRGTWRGTWGGAPATLLITDQQTAGYSGLHGILTSQIDKAQTSVHASGWFGGAGNQLTLVILADSPSGQQRITVRPDGPDRLVGRGESSFARGPHGPIDLRRAAQTR
jgi:hypothetical protein